MPKCANHPQWPGQLHDVPGTACPNYKPKPAELSELDETIRRILLSNGQFAIVDAADYEWLNQYTWTLVAAGYAGRNEKGELVLVHRQIMQLPKGMVVDHIDGGILNNRRSNLRVCTREQNLRNCAKRRHAASRYKCVGYDETLHKWYARFRYQGLHLWLGYFDDEAEAARAYDRKAVEYFGEFARLNFPDEWPPERRQQVYADAQPLRDALRAKAAQAQVRKSKRRKAKSKGRKTEGKNSTVRKKRWLARDAHAARHAQNKRGRSRDRRPGAN